MYFLIKLAVACVTLAASLKPSPSPATTTDAPDERGDRLREATARAGDTQLVEAERVDRNLIACSAAMALAAPASPLLRILSGSVTVYADRVIFAETYTALIKERKINVSLLESLTVIGGLTTGQFFLSALGSYFYHVGRKLLDKTRAASGARLIDVFGERPRFVWIEQNGVEVQMPVEDLGVGDIIIVGAGEIIPVDGRIADGVALIDQRALTGESQPVEKGRGEDVLAATVVLQGRIWIAVEKAGADTLAVQIEEILNRTAEYRPAVQVKFEKLVDRLVLPTVGLGVWVAPRLGWQGFVAVVSSNFSEALGIVAPLGMLNHIKLAADRGILIKDGSALEKLNQVDTVVFDKTGTLTLDDPYVGNIYSADGHSVEEVLTYAAAAESRQSHPIARAILREARERGLPHDVSNAAIHRIGFGVEIYVDDKVIAVGSARFLKNEGIEIPERWRKLQAEDDEQGYSLVYVAVDRKCCGVIELKPTIRPEAREVIRRMGQRNLELIIISGDHASPTRHLAAELGIGRYYAEKLPEDKARLIEQLHREGRTVCFVGDGINDAIALKRASVSISLHGASTAAVDTAQVILMNRDLSQLDNLFDLAASYDKNLKVGTATTFIPSALCLYGSLLGIVGIPTAFILYMSSLSVGYGVAMWPRFSSPLRERRTGAGDGSGEGEAAKSHDGHSYFAV